MRISDWSSDVCSSDLRRGRGDGLADENGVHRVASAGDARDSSERTRLPCSAPRRYPARCFSPKTLLLMHALVVTLARWAAFAAVVPLSLLPFDAAALSRRDAAAAEALNQRMAAAEQRYREALVKIGNAEPGAVDESNAAIEDMEDVVAACLKQKGCHVNEIGRAHV